MGASVSSSNGFDIAGWKRRSLNCPSIALKSMRAQRDFWRQTDKSSKFQHLIIKQCGRYAEENASLLFAEHFEQSFRCLHGARLRDERIEGAIELKAAGDLQTDGGARLKQPTRMQTQNAPNQTARSRLECRRRSEWRCASGGRDR